MKGSGILRGLGVTFTHFIQTYLEDIRWGKKRYHTDEGIERRRSSDLRGIVTVQYPEEKLPVPESFRFLPYLVYDDGPNGEKIDRCTSCGICAKVCPPQCIWIIRTNDPNTGRPIPSPAEFFIDIDICMNCGMCAEYCPFNAIKMDHDYEIASFDRMKHHIYNKSKLSKPASYYATMQPTQFAEEEIERAQKAAKTAAKTAS
jgi:NADH-quinone oxidoreductase subunit I